MNLVNEIDKYMEAEKIGIVAHFYMDAEIQVWLNSTFEGIDSSSIGSSLQIKVKEHLYCG